ncbi:Oidioi.mRNA.OKI2018_I69.chr2.g6791.t1.cds [Oikopleura dioica]|uniref:Oidioi.mRNA.OKI2018_I69.chr2.g6791.t1.cds n=1 Tax=Oikopleura dioica TaxID=34765 RepID=A0ABN7TAY5_OIKDI|nr:Oidioi.mRNA.OKI2018_I69.chr2.g6791.t1.cds [Oikopleura dioica]
MENPNFKAEELEHQETQIGKHVISRKLPGEKYDMEKERREESPTEKNVMNSGNIEVSQSRFEELRNWLLDGPMVRSVIMAVEWFLVVAIVVGAVLAIPQ